MGHYDLRETTPSYDDPMSEWRDDPAFWGPDRGSFSGAVIVWALFIAPVACVAIAALVWLLMTPAPKAAADIIAALGWFGL